MTNQELIALVIEDIRDGLFEHEEVEDLHDHQVVLVVALENLLLQATGKSVFDYFKDILGEYRASMTCRLKRHLNIGLRVRFVVGEDILSMVFYDSDRDETFSYFLDSDTRSEVGFRTPSLIRKTA